MHASPEEVLLTQWKARLGSLAEVNRLWPELLAARSSQGPLWQELQRLLQSQPKAFLELVGGIPDSGISRSLVRLVAGEMAQLDRAGGLQWAESLLNPAARSFAYAGVLEVWAERQPEEAAAWLQAPPEMVDLSMLTCALVESWVQSDPARAAGWLQGLPGTEAQMEGTRSLARTWSQMSATDSRSWVEQLPPGAQRDIAVASTAEGWALEDAAGAIDWMLRQQFADADQRTEVIYGLASDYAGQAPQRAESWLETLSPGELRDEAILGVADTLRALQPERALHWLHQLKDEEEREDAMEDLLATWPAAAKLSADEAKRQLPQIVRNGF